MLNKISFQWQTVINVSDVVCLAFVFHASYLEHVWVNCAGMELVYITRYFVDSDRSLALLPPDLQLPLMPSSVVSFIYIPRLRSCNGR
jgi:hypothetical protein